VVLHRPGKVARCLNLMFRAILGPYLAANLEASGKDRIGIGGRGSLLVTGRGVSFLHFLKPRVCGNRGRSAAGRLR
jgi:hypothetical protein